VDGVSQIRFEIIKDDKKNGKYTYKSEHVDKADIQRMYIRQKQEAKTSELWTEKKPFIIEFKKEEVANFMEIIDKLTKEDGYVLTRYFSADKAGAIFFAAFEQRL
jgi:hypothetical protein